MRQSALTLALLLRSLLFDLKCGGILAYRLLVPLLVGISKQPLTWFVLTLVAILYLSFAPIAGKWNDKDTGRSFIALLLLYPLAEVLGKAVSTDVTALSIKRHLAWLAEVDEVVHEFNVIRSLNAKELREFSGDYTLAEVQMRMADSQDRMVETMGNMTAKLPAGEAASEEAPLLNLSALTNTVLLIIWGTQGGGKTTLAKLITRLRARKGHSIVVADPHGSQQEWGEWQVIGSGRNYEQLNAYLKQFDEAITRDYQQYSQGKRDFAYSTLLVDEFTQWADRCKNSASFVKSACSDLRKVRRCVILITHSDTITGLGDAKGLRDAIDRSAVKLQLETRMNSSGEYEPTGLGWLQYPGQEKQRVRIPQASEFVLPAATAPAVDVPLDPRDQLEQVYQQTVAHPYETPTKGELTHRQRAILEYCSNKNQWFSPSDLQAKLKACRGTACEELIADFAALETAGYGAVRVTGKTVQWRYFSPF